MCDYKDSYLTLRKYWHDAYKQEKSTRHKIVLPEENYDCNIKAGMAFTILISYECIFNSIHFYLMLVHYYKNVLDIKFKKQ